MEKEASDGMFYILLCRERFWVTLLFTSVVSLKSRLEARREGLPGQWGRETGRELLSGKLDFQKRSSQRAVKTKLFFGF